MTAASVQDRDGGRSLGAKLAPRPRLRHLWADGSYAGALEDRFAAILDITLEIVRRPPGATGFTLLPKRWVVERTLAWLSQARLLTRDDDALPQSTAASIMLRMIQILLRRLAQT